MKKIDVKYFFGFIDGGRQLEFNLIIVIIVVMSDTSIGFKDEGYTSPDFLTNLFKKPLYSALSMSSFDHHSHSERDIHSSTKQNNLPPIPLEKRSSSPLKFKNHTSNTSKTFKSTPTIDQEKISNSKYKIFIKTLLQGTMAEEQINQLWTKLEDSLKNPFLFDKFIDEIKLKSEKELQVKQEKELEEKLKKMIVKVKSKTPEKISMKEVLLCPCTQAKKKSIQSENDVEKTTKDSIRKDIAQIRKALLKGERSIRQK